MKIGFYTVALVVAVTVLITGAGYAVKTKATIARLEGELARAKASQQSLVTKKLTHIRKGAIRVQGKIESSEAVAVSPQVGAPLAKVLVREGEAVEAGQVLAKLDDTGLRAAVAESERAWADARRRLVRMERKFAERDTLHAEAVEEARLTYERAVAQFRMELKDSEQNLAKCRVELEANRLDMDRTGELAGQKLVAQSEYDRAKLAVERSSIEMELAKTRHADLRLNTQNRAGEPIRIRLRTAELERQRMLQLAEDERLTGDDLDRVRAEVKGWELRTQLAKEDLVAAVVRAPMRGVIAEASNSPRLLSLRSSIGSGHPLSFEELREVGKRVGPQDILFVLEGLNEVVVKVDVDEMDINRIQVSDTARITGAGFADQALTGEVTAISPEAIYVAEGITTFETTVRVIDALGRARLGMSTEVEILTGEQG